MKKIPKRLIINEITLSGFLYALFIVTRLIFKDINLINGYSPQIHLIVLVLGMFCLKTYWFRCLFLLVSAFFNIMFGTSSPDLFFDYFLPCWGFFPFLILFSITSKIWKNNKQYSFLIYFIVICFHIISYFILTMSYTISGIINFKVNFITSITLNGPIGGISCLISTIVVILCLHPLYIMRDKTTRNIYWQHFNQKRKIKVSFDINFKHLNHSQSKIVFFLLEKECASLKQIKEVINENHLCLNLQTLIFQDIVNFKKSTNKEYYYFINKNKMIINQTSL